MALPRSLAPALVALLAAALVLFSERCALSF
jgi:hypothetical protein